jgi:hypothetical protein
MFFFASYMPADEEPTVFYYFIYSGSGINYYTILAIFFGSWVGIRTVNFELKIGNSLITGIIIGFIQGILTTSNYTFDYNRNTSSQLFGGDEPLSYFSQSYVNFWVFIAILTSTFSVIITAIMQEIKSSREILSELYPKSSV